MITQLPSAFLMGQSPMELFVHGGPIMWPILIVALLAITIVVERIIFIARETASRQPAVIEKILNCVENDDVNGAIATGKKSKDYVARILTNVLEHTPDTRANSLARAANEELSRYQQGMAALETCITASPLLGLLGTVTGMMETFGALGQGGDIAASASKITGGVGEALIATACGLAVAIIALFPYNILAAKLEVAKHDIANASNALEITLSKKNS